MHSTDVIAYATPDGDLLCPACARNAAYDNDDAYQAALKAGCSPLEATTEFGEHYYTPAFAGSEVDSIPVCDHCGYEIDGYTLTGAGRRELARSQMGRKVRELFEDNWVGGGYGIYLPTYAWPGTYQLFYVTKDSGALCPACANKWLDEPDQWDADQMAPQDYDVYWEGPTIHCDHCDADIESVYGDPDAEEEEATE